MKNITTYRETEAVGHIKDSAVYTEWLDENDSIFVSKGEIYEDKLSAYDKDGEEIFISDPEIIEIVTAEIAEYETRELFESFEKEPSKRGDGIYVSRNNEPVHIFKDGEHYEYIPTSEKGIYDVYDENDNFVETTTLTEAEVRASNKALSDN